VQRKETNGKGTTRTYEWARRTGLSPGGGEKNGTRMLEGKRKGGRAKKRRGYKTGGGLRKTVVGDRRDRTGLEAERKTHTAKKGNRSTGQKTRNTSPRIMLCRGSIRNSSNPPNR